MVLSTYRNHRGLSTHRGLGTIGVLVQGCGKNANPSVVLLVVAQVSSSPHSVRRRRCAVRFWRYADTRFRILHWQFRMPWKLERHAPLHAPLQLLYLVLGTETLFMRKSRMYAVSIYFAFFCCWNSIKIGKIGERHPLIISTHAEIMHGTKRRRKPNQTTTTSYQPTSYNLGLVELYLVPAPLYQCQTVLCGPNSTSRPRPYQGVPLRARAPTNAKSISGSNSTSCPRLYQRQKMYIGGLNSTSCPRPYTVTQYRRVEPISCTLPY